ncbi:MAG: RNA methyltransferase [Polyangiaceae bacterium]
MLRFPIHQATRFVIVHPHYPENVGAAARAMKTMGFERLVLVKPGKMACPEHVMARKMAVKSLDVLEAAMVVKTLDEALAEVDVVYGSTARSGVSYIQSPREAAEDMVTYAAAGKRLAILLGNEKTGLDNHQIGKCTRVIRIPMAAEQPSVNLAQAVQILAYELFARGLADYRPDGKEDG